MLTAIALYSISIRLLWDVSRLSKHVHWIVCASVILFAGVLN